MTITNRLSDIRIIGNVLELHCVEILENGRVIGHWRTTIQKNSDLAILEGHCTEMDVMKIQEHLALLGESIPTEVI